MMKSATSARRVYTRKGITHVLLSGKCFHAPKDSAIDATMSAIVEIAEGDKTAKVTVKRPKKKSIVETWKAGEVPEHTPRG